MWLMNHLFNPLVRWILGSRLHGLMSKNVMLISFQGRKSGKHYTTPVEYFRSDQEVWIIVGFPEKKRWWMNLKGGAAVNLCLRGEWYSGLAVALEGEADRTPIVRGLELITAHYPALNRKYKNYSDPSFDLAGIVLVRIDLD